MPDPQIIGYDPNTGKAITGYDPNSGKAIFAASVPTKLTAPNGPAAGRGTGYRSNADVITPNLPAIGGAIGGLIGAETGPGAIGTAAAGGAIGESAKQLINRMRGTGDVPQTGGEAAAGIAGQAALQGAFQGAGIGLSKLGDTLGPALMQKAVKPAVEKTVAGAAKATQIAKTLLDEGITVSKGGLEKLNGLLQATNDEIRSVIGGSTKVINPTAVASRGAQTEAKFATQVNPTADVNAVRQSVQDFVGTAPTKTTLQPVIGSDGRPLMDARGRPVLRPQTGIPVQAAQDMKTGTYRALAGKYGEEGSAATETQKALARGLKEELVNAHPELADLNARDSALIQAQQALTRRVIAAGNANPAGFAMVAQHPMTFLAALMDRSPAVKSLLARGLYSSAARAGGVTPTALRVALAAIAQSPDEKQP